MVIKLKRLDRLGRSSSVLIDVLAMSLIVVAICVCFHELLLASPDYVFGGDVLLGFNYIASFLRKTVFEYKQVPLWDPYRLSGMPYVSHPVTPSFFSLTTLLILLAPDEVLGIRYVTIIHIVLAGLFMFYMMKIMYGRPASLVASIAYALCGFLISRTAAGHVNFVIGCTWLPLSVGLFYKALSEYKLKYAFFTGVPLGMFVLGGAHYGQLIYTLLLLSLLFAYDIIVSPLNKDNERRKKFFIKILTLPISLLSFLSVSAVKLLPTLELYPYLYRAKVGTQLGGFPNVEFLLKSLLVYDLRLGIEYHAYIGPLILGLAVFAFVVSKREAVFPFLSLMIFTVIATPISSLNICAILQDYLPFIKGALKPIRASEFIIFSLIVSSGIGMAELFRRVKKRLNRKMAIGLLLLVTIATVLDFSLHAIDAIEPIEVPRNRTYLSSKPGELSALLIEYPNTIRVAKNDKVNFILKIQNVGDTVWLKQSNWSDGKGAVHLLLYVGERVLEFKLPKDVYPSEFVTVNMNFSAPSKAGEHDLKLNLFSKSIDSFSWEPVHIAKLSVLDAGPMQDRVEVSTVAIMISKTFSTHLSYLEYPRSRYDFRLYTVPVYIFPPTFAERKEMQIAWGIEADTWITYYYTYLNLASIDPYYGSLNVTAAKDLAKLLGILNIKYLATDDRLPNLNCLDKDLEIKKGLPGLLYENKRFLPRAFLARHTILLIGCGLNDEGVKFAVNLIKDPAFDPAKVALIGIESPFIDDCHADFLDKFDGVILLNFKAHNTTRAVELLSNYQRGRNGKVFLVNSTDNECVGLTCSLVLLNFEKISDFLTTLGNDAGEVEILEYTPNKIRIRAKTNSSSFLVVSEVYYPGWTAYVNGKESSVLVCDSILRGVSLEDGGEHEVILEYKPMSYWIGFVISAITVVLLLFFILKNSFVSELFLRVLRKKSEIVPNSKPSGEPRQSKSVRIVYVVNGLGFAASVSLGGSDKRVLEIGSRLSKQKASVSILTTTTGFNVLRKEGLDGKYYVLAPPFSWYPIVERTSVGRILSYLFEIVKGLSLRMPEHDVIFSSSDFICDTIPAWNHKRKNLRIKWVAMIHHMIDLPSKRKGNILVNIINYLSQQTSFILMKNRVDLIFVYETPEGRSIKNYLSKIGISHEKIMTVMNGVDYKFIAGIPDQQRLYDACFVGGLRPSKGIFDLPQIWKRICKERSLAKLVIIGGGPAENTAALRREIMKNKVSDNIIIAGPLSGEKLFKLMKSCRILISPSYEEGWGIAVCEAMSCRLPVVAYDLPAYEVFDDAVIKVPVGNIEAFVTAALELLSSEKLWNEASARAARTAERFDWDKAAEKEWMILNELVD